MSPSQLLTSLVLLLYVVGRQQVCCQLTNVTTSTTSRDVINASISDELLQRVMVPSREHVSADGNNSVIVSAGARCNLTTRDPSVRYVVAQLVKNRASLIEYRLNFTDYTVNPLTTADVKSAYRADRWTRVTTSHGQTLLSLAFNYGVLSMSTLTLGTEKMNVRLVDSPSGCFALSTDVEKIRAVQYLLMRDFDPTGLPKTIDDARVCHEVILDDGGYAKFRHNCCYVTAIQNRPDCTTEIGNIWLDLLYAMLVIVRVGLLLFSPAMFISAIESMSTDYTPYVVKLKDKLTKTVWICKSSSGPFECKVLSQDGKQVKTVTLEGSHRVQFQHVIDLNYGIGFPKLRAKVEELAKDKKLNKKLKVKFEHYDIMVDYKRTMLENAVPVGLLDTLFRWLIRCRVRHAGPFEQCCRKKMFTTSEFSSCSELTWSMFCRKFVLALLVIMILPFPFYIRLALYYGFEETELLARKTSIEARGLVERYDSSFIHYLRPTHWLFICMYVIYAMTASGLAFLSKCGSEGYRPKAIIVSAFRDLKTLRLTDVLSMAVTIMIRPLDRFGACGCLLGVIYWPLALIYTILISICQLIPTLYLTLRIAYHANPAVIKNDCSQKLDKYQTMHKPAKDMFKLKTTDSGVNKESNKVPEYDVRYLNSKHANIDADASDIIHFKEANSSEQKNKDERNRKGRIAVNVLSAVLGILTLYSCVIILSEVIGCLVEIATFTIIGIIVNAGTLLKYVMLALLIIIYSYDCFNNVAKKYLKINKSMFAKIRDLIVVDLSSETPQPSVLQDNCSYKIQHINQQHADKTLFSKFRDLIAVDMLTENQQPSQLPENRGYKIQHINQPTDCLAPHVPLHWMINDLVMFVDTKDRPRIPLKLFQKVCDIKRVVGAPNRAYLGNIEALMTLVKTILFVCLIFIIIATFGSIYNVSPTNQMLAVLLFGLLPLVLRTLLFPPALDVEMTSVSFSNRNEESVENFSQCWPIYDLPFRLADELNHANDDQVDGYRENGCKLTDDISNNNSAQAPRLVKRSTSSNAIDMEKVKPMNGFVANINQKTAIDDENKKFRDEGNKLPVVYEENTVDLLIVLPKEWLLSPDDEIE